jgi:hypothetical protein
MERPKLRLPTGTIINGLEEVKAGMPLMKTRGPTAKDTSAFNILHEKIEKWLEAGDSVTDRELV